jgi:hypothetical protein
VSAELTWMALAETSEATTAANCPAFRLKIPRWSGKITSTGVENREIVFKREIPDEESRRDAYSFGLCFY